MIRRRGLLLVAPLALLAACGRREPIVDVRDASYGGTGLAATRRLSLTDYENAIVRAGAERGWVFDRLGPGHLEGSVLVRGKHRANVDVFYDLEDFSIVYKSSENLNYDPEDETIHPNYNSWIQLLESDIRAEIQRLRAS